MLWRQKLSPYQFIILQKMKFNSDLVLVFLNLKHILLRIKFFHQLNTLLVNKNWILFNLIMSVPPPRDVIIIAIIVYTDPGSGAGLSSTDTSLLMYINHVPAPQPPWSAGAKGQVSGGQMPVWSGSWGPMGCTIGIRTVDTTRLFSVTRLHSLLSEPKMSKIPTT